MLLGSVPIENDPGTFGGVTVLNVSLIKFLKEEGCNYTFVPFNKFGTGSLRIINPFYMVFAFLFRLLPCDVIFLNVTKKGIYYVSPVLFIISKLFRKEFIVRIFAGNLDVSYNASNYMQKIIVKLTVFRSDTIYVETKYLVKYLRDLGVKTKIGWLPNCRKPHLSAHHEQKRSFRKRFVFVSHVKSTKGIHEIIKASDHLDSEYVIDVYGPIVDKTVLAADFDGVPVNYKGVLNPDDVISTLLKYDVLLLPTYHPGEGYPGIIIEAKSIGMPVITTKWGAIDEIVVHGYDGLLVDIKDSAQLKYAIESIDDSLYQNLSKNAALSFSEFNERSVYENIFKDLC